MKRGVHLSAGTSSHVVKLTIFSVLTFACCGIGRVDTKSIGTSSVCNGKKDGLYAHPTSCSLFYSCTGGTESVVSCPAGLWFDPDRTTCRSPSSFNTDDYQKCQQLVATSAPSTTTRQFQTTLRIVGTTSTSQPTTTTKVTDANIQWSDDDDEEDDDGKNQSKPGNKKPAPEFGLPSKVSMKFSVGKDSVNLNLQKKPNFATGMKVLAGTRGRFSSWSPPADEQFDVYSDPSTNSSVVVATYTDRKGRKQVLYQGSFTSNNQRYYMAPDSGSGGRNEPMKKSATNPASFNGSSYSITSENDRSPCDNNIARGAQGGNDSSSLLTPLEVQINSQLYNFTTKQNLGVELFLVIDYSIYYKWYMQSSATTTADKSNDAIQNIRYYYAHIINGIDTRYSTINNTDFGFYVRMAGYYIATSPGDSPWTEAPDVKVAAMTTDAYLALDKLQAWVALQAGSVPPRLPRFDAVALFTANYLQVTNTANPYHISGLANIGMACTTDGVSINRDFGEYATIQTSTHELGHNLGSNHDDPVFGCSFTPADQYIMASAPGSLTNATFSHPFTFSSCSVQAFRSYVSTLNSANQNCLLNPATNVDPTNFAAFTQQYPGQKYSPDVQCQLLYGKTSFYCAGGGSRDMGICLAMQCWDSTISPSGSCVANVQQRAADGTTCANSSWCIMGQCVFNPIAPSAPQTCIYGDYRGLIGINATFSMTCQAIVATQLYRCYDNNYYGTCCQSCAAARNSSNIECEFGDKDPTYCSTSIRSWDCYDDATRATCCATCARLRISTPASNCNYGDRADWCKTLRPASCYTSAQTCCQTCSSLATGPPGCEYGDQVSGCSIDYCSSADIRPVCCGTCSAFIYTTATTKTVATPAKTNTTVAQTTKATTLVLTTVATTKGATTRIPTTVAATVKTTMATVAPTPPSPLATPCAMGDQSTICPTMDSSWCYSYHDVCCATCPKYYNASNVGCEYGDKVDWCKSYVQCPSDCQRPEVAASCCSTCKKFSPGSTLCLWCTDKADWCNGLFPGYCYDTQVQGTCCATCNKYQANRTGSCMYGDFYSWCAPMYCDMNPVECCQTCAKK